MKEAVVFVLDANETMAASVHDDDDPSPTTRFDCAKQVCLDMMSDLMIRSKTHEVACLILKSPLTRHHFWEQGSSHGDDDPNEDIPFPNILELGGDGMYTGVNRIHGDLLKKIQQLQVSQNTKTFQGDFCDGIIVATDALFKKTSGKKYQRRIVLITDAEHKVHVDSKQLLVVLDSLRAMECRLEVIGIDFESQAEYETAVDVKAKNAVRPTKSSEMDQMQEDDGSATDVSGDSNVDDDDGDCDEENEELEDMKVIKSQNEKLLISLTEKTGGFVMAAKELQPILQKMLGHRRAKAMNRKVQFQIAPTLVLEARFSLLYSKTNRPTLKQMAAEIVEGSDSNASEFAKDSDGKEIVESFTTTTTYWDPEQENKEVMEKVDAYAYGSGLVPISGVDKMGLMQTSPVKLSIFGYLARSCVPRHLHMGPPYILTGGDSLKTCAAIAALAVAMERKQRVAIANFVKSANADPILVGLFPHKHENESAARHLLIIQLPFQGIMTPSNAKLAKLVTEEGDSSSKAASVADDLIESLMLPEGKFQNVPNPHLRSFHKTVVQRILDPACTVVSARSSGPEDPLSTPIDVLEKAAPAIATFCNAFPLSKADKNDSSANNVKKGKRNATMTYKDFLDE